MPPTSAVVPAAAAKASAAAGSSTRQNASQRATTATATAEQGTQVPTATKKKRRRGKKKKQNPEESLFIFSAPQNLATSTYKKDNGGRKSKRRPKAITRFEEQDWEKKTKEMKRRAREGTNVKQGHGFECPRCSTECGLDARECYECGLECYYEAGVGAVVLKERKGNEGEAGRENGGKARGSEEGARRNACGNRRGGLRRWAEARVDALTDDGSPNDESPEDNRQPDADSGGEEDDRKPAARREGAASPVELARGNDDADSEASERTRFRTNDSMLDDEDGSTEGTKSLAASGEEDFGGGGGGNVDFDAVAGLLSLDGHDNKSNTDASSMDRPSDRRRSSLGGMEIDESNDGGRASNVSDLSNYQSAVVSQSSERLEEIRQQLKEANRAKGELAGQVSDLRTRYAAVAAERDALARKEKEKRATDEEMARKVADLEGRISRRSDQLKEVREKLEETTRAKSKRISDLEALYDAVSGEKDEATASNEELARRVAELEDRVKTVNGQLFGAREAVKKRNGEMEKLQADFAKLETDRDVLDRRLDDETASKEVLEKTLATEREELAEHYQNANDKVAAAEKKRKKYKSDAQLAASAKDRMEREHNATVARMEREHNATVARLNAEVASLRGQIPVAPVSSTLPVWTPFQRSNDLEKLQAEAAALKGERDAAVAKWRKLKSESEAEAKSVTSERDTLAEALVVAARERDELDGQVEDLESKLAAVYSTQRGEIERRVDRVTGQLSHAWNAAKERSNEIEKLQSELQTVRWERDALVEELEASGERRGTMWDETTDRVDCADAMPEVANGRRGAPQDASNASAVERDYKATVARLTAENKNLKSKLVEANSKVSTLENGKMVLVTGMTTLLENDPDARKLVATQEAKSSSGSGKRVSLEDSDSATSDADSVASPSPEKEDSHSGRPLRSALKKSSKGKKRVSFDSNLEHGGKENNCAGRKRPLAHPSASDEPLSPSKRTQRDLDAGTVEEGKKYKRKRKSCVGGKSESSRVVDLKYREDDWCGFL